VTNVTYFGLDTQGQVWFTVYMTAATNHHNDHNDRCEEAEGYDDLCNRCYYDYLVDDGYFSEVDDELTACGS
jgi:hypothetical protein